MEASRAYNNLGACLYFIGDVARATDAIEHAVEHAERLGNARMLRYARGALASHDYELGRWDEALTGSDEILHGHEGEAHYLAPGALRVRAAILLARGEIDAALREIEEAVARARAAKDPQALVPTLIAAARIYAEAERLAEATSYLDEFIAHPVAPPLAPVWATWHAHALGRALDVRRVVDGAPESRWKTAALGILDRDYALAATMFREIGVGVEEAYAHLRAAEQRASEGRHARAEPHVEQALDFYRSVGATFYIRRAEQLLRA